MAAGSFAERFAYQRLGNLTPDAATAALVVPAQEQEVARSLDAPDLVLSLSRGAPLLQLYADGVWRAVGPERGGRLELEPGRADPPGRHRRADGHRGVRAGPGRRRARRDRSLTLSVGAAAGGSVRGPARRDRPGAGTSR